MWPALLTLLPGLLDKLLPDKGAADAAKLELIKLAASGELAKLTADTDLAKGQLDVNVAEAGNTGLFVAGWRPFIGWICGASLAFKFIGGPALAMLAQSLGHPVTLPDLGTDELMPLLLGMLGLGAMRTIEKIKGAS